MIKDWDIETKLDEWVKEVCSTIGIPEKKVVVEWVWIVTSHGNVFCRRCRHASQCPLFAGLAKHRHKGPSSTERSVSQMFAAKLRWFGRVGMARTILQSGYLKSKRRQKSSKDIYYTERIWKAMCKKIVSLFACYAAVYEFACFFRIGFPARLQASVVRAQASSMKSWS